MNIPDYVSAVIGHRVWQWDGSALVSLNGEFWPPGQALEAECSRSFARKCEGVQLHDHRAPQMYCSCGIYAAKSSEQLAGLVARKLHNDRRKAVARILSGDTQFNILFAFNLRLPLTDIV